MRVVSQQSFHFVVRDSEGKNDEPITHTKAFRSQNATQDQKLTDPRLDNHLTEGLETKLLIQESKTKGKDPRNHHVECVI
jgi:hypothetical protein